jgi:2'-phosphotransferase
LFETSSSSLLSHLAISKASFATTHILFIFIIMSNKVKRPRLDSDSKSNNHPHHKKKQGGRGNKREKQGGRNQGPPSGKGLSHSLSWALRHAAPELGLSMTPDGYVPVQEVLACQHTKLKGVTLEAIQQVVVSNDKQRFKLQERPRKAYFENNSKNNNNEVIVFDEDSETVLCIRANQGHSIKTIDPNLLLTKLEADELMAVDCIVHGTHAVPWKLIQIQGLKKMNRTHIHSAAGLPTEDGVISGMRKSCTVYIYINAQACARDGIPFFQSDNGVLLTAGIDGVLRPKYFSHVTDAQGGVILDHRTNTNEGG